MFRLISNFCGYIAWPFNISRQLSRIIRLRSASRSCYAAFSLQFFTVYLLFTIHITHSVRCKSLAYENGVLAKITTDARQAHESDDEGKQKMSRHTTDYGAWCTENVVGIDDIIRYMCMRTTYEYCSLQASQPLSHCRPSAGYKKTHTDTRRL